MRIRTLATTAILCAAALSATAQESRGSFGYGRFIQLNPQLDFSNPAMLSSFGKGSKSAAEVFADKTDGGFKGIEESPDSFGGGACAESFNRISDRTVFYGSLSYTYFRGNDMGGEILMDPDYNPVNFLEESSETNGRKTRELYHLVGGMSYTFSPRWSAGVKFDYESGDMAKAKDPRFRSVLMDMRIEAGVSFRPSEALTLGAALLYRSNLEQLSAGIFGTTDRSYYTWSDKGGFLGARDLLAGDNSYISVQSTRPMANSHYGLSLQAYGGSSVKWFNELQLRYRDGYYGRKSSSTPTFFEFSGVEVEYEGSLLLGGSHRFGLSLEYEPLTNYENIFSYSTPSGKSTIVVYSGQNKILSRTDIAGDISYAFLGERWDAGAVAWLNSRSQSVTLYPFSREQYVMTASLRAYARRRLSVENNLFTIGADGLFRTGTGDKGSVNSVASVSSSGISSVDSCLDPYFEYRTASAAGAGLSFGWERAAGGKMTVYSRISDSFVYMLSAPEHLSGRRRNVVSLIIGCAF